MALQKEITTLYGVPANYFKVVSLEFNMLLNKATIKLVGYYNQEAREGDNKALFIKDYNVKPEEYLNYFSVDILNQDCCNGISMAYKYIKDTDVIFANAIDLI